jgi:hypothetical protein
LPFAYARRTREPQRQGAGGTLCPSSAAAKPTIADLINAPQKGKHSSTRASAQGHYRGELTTNEMTVMASSVAQNQSHCEGSASGSI